MRHILIYILLYSLPFGQIAPDSIDSTSVRNFLSWSQLNNADTIKKTGKGPLEFYAWTKSIIKEVSTGKRNIDDLVTIYKATDGYIADDYTSILCDNIKSDIDLWSKLILKSKFQEHFLGFWEYQIANKELEKKLTEKRSR